MGLTPREARGWYIHNVLMPSILKGTFALSIASFALASTFTSLEAYLNSTLALHMIAQHFLFVAAGLLFAYGVDSLILVASRLSRDLHSIYDFLVRGNRYVNRYGVLTFFAAAALCVYWYLPANFNMLALNETTHIEMHTTLLALGALVYVGSKTLTKTMQRVAPIIMSKGIGLSGAFLLLTTAHLYAAYPLNEQVEAGVVMVAMMALMDLTILPAWLYSFFGRNTAQTS